MNTTSETDIDTSALLDEIQDMLLGCDLFNNYAPAELCAIARYFNITDMHKGEVIFREGDIGSFMCILIEGDITVLKSSLEEGNVFLASLRKGRTFGEMAVLDGERRSATCIAESNCSLLTLSKEALDRMMADVPATAAKVVRTVAVSLSRRLRMADGKLVDRRTNNVL